MGMGIDIYARWQGQTTEEEQAQYTGFSVVHGHVGYLREAYHGLPYATYYLVREAFDGPGCQAQIPAALLCKRLARTLKLVWKRERRVYDEKDVYEIIRVMQSFVAFVELCARKEKETGKPVTIIASY